MGGSVYSEFRFLIFVEFLGLVFILGEYSCDKKLNISLKMVFGKPAFRSIIWNSDGFLNLVETHSRVLIEIQFELTWKSDGSQRAVREHSERQLVTARIGDLIRQRSGSGQRRIRS